MQIIKICENCKKQFYANKKIRRFCSGSCRSLALIKQQDLSHLKICGFKSGSDHYDFKGGYLRKDGYVRLSIDGRRPYEHCRVVEDARLYPLESWESVHHIEHDRSDNRLDNLCVMAKSDHIRLHKKGEI